MRKAIINLTYFFSISLAVFSAHEALAERSPSVEPMAEIDIENQNNKTPPNGYNFNEVKSNRTPAGIVAKDPKNSRTPYSMIGPFIFLLALPFAIWMVISKKFSNENEPEEKIEYFSKSYQFKPYKTEYQKQEDQDDDIDYPKAS